MRRKREPLIKRTVSGSLAALMTAISVLSTSGALPAFASESNVKLSYQKEEIEKIGLYVQAENESFAPGGEVNLTIYIQNNSDQPLTEGTLKWVDKKETLQNAVFVYETEDREAEEKATPDSAQEETEAPEETEVPEETEAPEETEMMPESAETKAETVAAGPASDFTKETKAAGPASDFGQDDGITVEEDWFEDEEEDSADDAEQSGPYLDEDGYVRNISLAPGEIFQIPFTAIVNEDIFGIRTRDIRFTFGARTPDNKRLSNYVKYQFNTGLMTMQPIELVGGNQVETNEENTMIFRLDMDDIEYMFEDDGSASKASDSNAIASDSEAEAEFTPAEVIDSETEKATPSEAEKATASEAEKETPEAEEAASEAEKATASEAKQEEEKAEEENEGIFRPEEVKYSIETYGVRLKGVKARFDEEASGPAESVTEVSYRVASDTKPGFYFGKVTASVRYNGNTYKTEQGFVMNVTGEGQMTLRGRLGDAEIIVSGEPESFGADDSEILSLQVTEVPIEKEELISTAMEKKAEESGVAVEKMKAMDIKVIADGEVRELSGPVTVTFAGLKLDKVNDPAEPEKEESLAEKAAALLNLDGESAEESRAEKSTEVWHLDEEAVELNDMESYINEDGDVVMETDHFSIFILVELPTAGGIINVTLEHWASVEEIVGSANAEAVTDTVFDKDNVKIKTKQTTTQIYTSDVLALQQSAYKNIEELSKVAPASKEIKNYTIEKVWVTTDKSNLGKKDWASGSYAEYLNGNDEKTIKLTNDSIIRIWYKEKVPDTLYKNSVTFYDHNVTDGRVYKSVDANPYEAGWSYYLSYKAPVDPLVANKTYKYLYSVRQGTNYTDNNALFVGSGPIMGSGQPASGNRSPWAKNTWNGRYLNQGNDIASDKKGMGIVKNLVTGLDSNGNLIYNSGIRHARFFEETYGKLADHYATKRLDGYNLQFRQQGDTYTLKYAAKGNSRKTGDLEVIQKHATSGTVYSNEFWPLDDCENYLGKDALMGVYGGSSKAYYWNRNWDADGNPDKNIEGAVGQSDFRSGSKDGAHNWHFGMRYDFTFKIGDYTGPMNYYFRGDDDFWLFIDGEKAIDIGGIHIASGQSIDIRKWLTDGDPNTGTTASQKLKDIYQNDKNHVYKCTVYFMERGGFGSCCYMKCTLPNYTEVPVIQVETTEVTVTKKWEDFNNPMRPQNVTIRLLRDNVEVDRINLTGTGDTWSYTWTELPKKDGQTGKKYNYTVEEVTPAGYEASQSGNTITNKLSPEVKVKVTKDWEDGGNVCGNRPEQVTFRLLADGSPVKVNNQEVKKTLRASDVKDGNSNSWVGSFEHLPKYRFTYDNSGNYTGFVAINYTVEEMNGTAPLTKGEKFAGKHGSTETDQYILSNISYPELSEQEKTDNYVAHAKFTNQHTHSLNAYKEWSDGNELHAEQSVWVGLYEKAGTAWHPVKDQLKCLAYNSTSKTFKASFSGLDPAKSYTVKELVAGTTENYDFAYDGKYYKGIDENGIYENSYVVSYSAVTDVGSHSCEKQITITNEISKIKIRVAKWIDNYDENLDENDLREDEFIVSVDQREGDFHTGIVLNHAGKPGTDGDELDERKYSGYIELTANSPTGITLTISEVMPKEYKKSNTFLTLVEETSLASIAGDSITVLPGADVVILVHNRFDHENYFHSDHSAMNKFDHTKFPGFQTAFNMERAALPEERFNGKIVERV